MLLVFARAIMSVGLSLNLSHLANLALDGWKSNASMTLNPISIIPQNNDEFQNHIQKSQEITTEIPNSFQKKYDSSQKPHNSFYGYDCQAGINRPSFALTHVYIYL